jgi:hypothetical protein
MVMSHVVEKKNNASSASNEDSDVVVALVRDDAFGPKTRAATVMELAVHTGSARKCATVLIQRQSPLIKVILRDEERVNLSKDGTRAIGALGFTTVYPPIPVQPFITVFDPSVEDNNEFCERLLLQKKPRRDMHWQTVHDLSELLESIGDIEPNFSPPPNSLVSSDEEEDYLNWESALDDLYEVGSDTYCSDLDVDPSYAKRFPSRTIQLESGHAKWNPELAARFGIDFETACDIYSRGHVREEESFAFVHAVTQTEICMTDIAAILSNKTRQFIEENQRRLLRQKQDAREAKRILKLSRKTKDKEKIVESFERYFEMTHEQMEKLSKKQQMGNRRSSGKHPSAVWRDGQTEAGCLEENLFTDPDFNNVLGSGQHRYIEEMDIEYNGSFWSSLTPRSTIFDGWSLKSLWGLLKKKLGTDLPKAYQETMEALMDADIFNIEFFGFNLSNLLLESIILLYRLRTDYSWFGAISAFYHFFTCNGLDLKTMVKNGLRCLIPCFSIEPASEAGVVSDVASAFSKMFSTVIHSQVFESIKNVLLGVVSFRLFNKDNTKKIHKFFGFEKGKSTIESISSIFSGIVSMLRIGDHLSEGVPFCSAFLSEDPITTITLRTEELLLQKELLYSGLPREGFRDRRDYVVECESTSRSIKLLIDKGGHRDKRLRELKKLKYKLDLIIDEQNAYLRGKSRQAPYFIVLHGASGVGKGTFLPALYAVYCYVKKRKFSEHDIWHKTIASVYWEGCNNEPCFHFSEVGNLTKKFLETHGDMTIKELTTLIDNLAYSPDMAFEGKGKTYVNPELIIIDTNTPDLMAKLTVNNDYAIKRRGLYVELTVLPEYCIPGTTQLDSAKSLENIDVFNRYKINVHKYKISGKASTKDPCYFVDKMGNQIFDMNAMQFFTFLEAEYRKHLALQEKLMDKSSLLMDPVSYIIPEQYEAEMERLRGIQRDKRSSSVDQLGTMRTIFETSLGVIRQIGEQKRICNDRMIDESSLDVLSFVHYGEFDDVKTETEDLSGPYIDELGVSVNRRSSKHDLKIQRPIIVDCSNTIAEEHFPFPSNYEFMDFWFSLATFAESTAHYVLSGFVLCSSLFAYSKYRKYRSGIMTTFLSLLWGLAYGTTGFGVTALLVKGIFSIVSICFFTDWGTLYEVAKLGLWAWKRKMLQGFRQINPLESRLWRNHKIAILSLSGLLGTTILVYKFLKKEVIESESKFLRDPEESAALSKFEMDNECGPSIERILVKDTKLWNNRVVSVPCLHTGTLDSLENSMRKNKRSAKVKLNEKDPGYGTFVFGLCQDYVIMNLHNFGTIEDKKLLCVSNKPDIADAVSFTSAWITLDDIFVIATDLCIVRVPGLLFHDIRKHITPDLNFLEEGKMRIKGFDTRFQYLGMVRITDKQRGAVFLQHAIQYKWPSHGPGQCGTPIFILKDRGCCLAGIHSAGFEGTGYGCLFTSDLVDKALEYFKTRVLVPIVSEGKEFPETEPPKPKSAFHYEVYDNLEYYGKKIGPIKLQKKSQVVSTGFDIDEFLFYQFGFIPEKEFVPPNFTPRFVGNNYVNPINNALRRLNKDGKPLDYVKLMRIKEEEVQRFIGVIGDRVLKPWDIETAINAVETDAYCRRMETSTSAGFGWKCKKGALLPVVHEEPGKVVREPIKALKQRLIECYTKYIGGETCRFINNGCLKDEPIDRLKDSVGKVRLFHVGSIEQIILERQYLGPFYTCLSEFNLALSSTVGINIYTGGDALIKTLREFSPHAVEADYKEYDTSVPFGVSETAYGIVYEVLKHFGYNEGALRIVRGLLTDGLHPNVDVCSDLFTATGKQPSGKYGTTEDNTVKNRIIAKYIFYSIPELQNYDFDENVLMVANGDDLLMSVKSLIIKEFNGKIFAQKALELLGMVVTSAMKDGSMKDYLDWDDVSYLKRRFVYKPEYGKYLCPLDLNSISRSMRWQIPSATITAEEQYSSLFTSVAIELFLHCNNEEQYARVLDLLNMLFVKKFGVPWKGVVSREKVSEIMKL